MAQSKDRLPDDDAEPGQKPIEKFKPEIEKQFKEVIEKPIAKEVKNEAKEHKLEKLEVKEHKLEKFEHKVEVKEIKVEKLEHKEFKPEGKELKPEGKELKPEKEKIEIKENKPELEKSQASEGFIPHDPSQPVEREGLLRHAEALEEQARQIRHFIDQGERPDLRHGALKDEPGQGGE